MKFNWKFWKSQNSVPSVDDFSDIEDYFLDFLDTSSEKWEFKFEFDPKSNLIFAYIGNTDHMLPLAYIGMGSSAEIVLEMDRNSPFKEEINRIEKIKEYIFTSGKIVKVMRWSEPGDYTNFVVWYYQLCFKKK